MNELCLTVVVLNFNKFLTTDFNKQVCQYTPAYARPLSLADVS